MERPMQVLRALAKNVDEGMRLTDLSVATGLGKSTVFRLLAKLQGAGLVERDKVSRRFFLGMEIFILGQAASTRFGIVELGRASAFRLADQSADTVFLSVHDGLDCVCVIRHEGSFPIKTLTMNVGDRRPMGVGSGALAMLAAMSDDEIERITKENVARNKERFPNFTPTVISRLVEDTRRDGYTFIDSLVVPGVCAVGVAIMDPANRPVAGLTVAAIAERMHMERRLKLVDTVRQEVAGIEKRIADLAGRTPAKGPAHR